jgi:hypothetical protein
MCAAVLGLNAYITTRTNEHNLVVEPLNRPQDTVSDNEGDCMLLALLWLSQCHGESKINTGCGQTTGTLKLRLELYFNSDRGR